MGLLGAIIAAGGATAKKYASSKSSSNKSSSSKSSGSKSSGSGSSGLYSNNVFNVGSSGHAPSGLPMYTPVNTAGGLYTIVPPGTLGASYNDASGYFSVKGNVQPSYTDPEYYQNLANSRYEEELAKYQDAADARGREAQEAIRRQTQATIDSINSNIPKINQDYESQQRANYISSERAKAGLGDYLSAAGYSGGMAESTALGLQSNYENLRSNTDQQKNNALTELQSMVAQAQATGDTNLANLATQKYQSMLSAMQSARQSADSMAQWEQSLATQNRQYADSLKQQGWENQFAEKGLAQDKELTLAGLAQEAALAKARLSRTGSGSKGYSVSNITAMMNAGLLTEEEGRKMLGLSGGANAATSLNSSAMGYPQVLNTLGGAMSATEVKQIAQQLISQGVSESYVEKALSVLGY